MKNKDKGSRFYALTLNLPCRSQTWERCAQPWGDKGVKHTKRGAGVRAEGWHLIFNSAYLLNNMNRLIPTCLGIITIALFQPLTNAAEQNGIGGAAMYAKRPLLAQKQDRLSTAERFLAAGVIKYRKGDKRGALADYNRAIQLNPRYALAHVNRGVVRSALGDRQGALSDFNRAIEIDPKYPQAYNNRGAIKYELGNKRGAIEDYTRAISIDYKFAQAYYNRGATRYELGDKRGALADYNIAIALDPNYGAAYYSRGVVRSELGDKQGAIEDYNRAIALDPNHAGAYYNRGAIRSELGDRHAASTDFDRAILLNPHYASKDYRISIAYYSPIVIFHPLFIGGYYHRGGVVYNTQTIFYNYSNNVYYNQPQVVNNSTTVIQVNPNYRRNNSDRQTTILNTNNSTVESTNRRVIIDNTATDRVNATPQRTRTRQVIDNSETIQVIPNSERDSDRQVVHQRARQGSVNNTSNPQIYTQPDRSWREQQVIIDNNSAIRQVESLPERTRDRVTIDNSSSRSNIGAEGTETRNSQRTTIIREIRQQDDASIRSESSERRSRNR
ncbi:tetratricopeptide repeat protein [Chamaesiphon polymorphus]|nr:tetratricopeptide repeat protein [Chamaesiphon polymorphus]